MWKCKHTCLPQSCRLIPFAAAKLGDQIAERPHTQAATDSLWSFWMPCAARYLWVISEFAYLPSAIQSTRLVTLLPDHCKHQFFNQKWESFRCALVLKETSANTWSHMLQIKYLRMKVLSSSFKDFEIFLSNTLWRMLHCSLCKTRLGAAVVIINKSKQW